MVIKIVLLQFAINTLQELRIALDESFTCYKVSTRSALKNSSFKRSLLLGINNAEKIHMIKIIAITLIVLGTLALVYQGFSYVQTKQDAKIGPLTIQHNEREIVPVPPIVGAVFIACGCGLLAVGVQRSI